MKDPTRTGQSDTFARVFAKTIDQMRAFTSKPILLSQTGVAPGAGQYANIHNLFEEMAQYRTLGLVWSNIGETLNHQNWRPEGDLVAEAALRLGVAGLTLART